MSTNLETQQWSQNWKRSIFIPVPRKTNANNVQTTIQLRSFHMLLLLLLSHFSHVRLCVTPYTAAHQAPPSLGSSRQEHEWVAISFSNAWKWKVKVKSLSRVRLLATPQTAAYQAPPSMGFSRQEYWSGVPLPSPALYIDHTQFHFHQQYQRVFVAP